jgi:hypothetical protein
MMWAKQRYVKDGQQTSYFGVLKSTLTPVPEIYGNVPADSFGLRALTACRAELVTAGYARRPINQYVHMIRGCWNRGVSRELVSPLMLVTVSASQC